MKKSDFVEVYIYFPTYTYSAGILYSNIELNDDQYRLDGMTLLTKEFYDKYNDNGIIDFTWIE